ncbi:MAG: hypothetical protein K6E84_01940 [Lachnospiraceae bacterium]|nr:hypothetical protein [Lachnospiraceae bacterium]
MKNQKFFLFGEIMLGVIWLIAGLIFAHFETFGNSEGLYWTGYVCGIVAIAVVCLVTYLWEVRTNAAVVEVGFMSVYFGFIYLFLALACNIVCMAKRYDQGIKVALFINLVLLILYIVMVFYANKNVTRVTGQLEVMAEKTEASGNIKSMMATVLGLAQSETVKQRLRALKEKTDYSDNLSQFFSADKEDEFYDCMTGIKQALLEDRSDDEILSMIDAAEKIWIQRNSLVSSAK